MTFASVLRKSISIAAAIAIALPSPMLASSFARTQTGVVGAGTPVVITAPAIKKIEALPSAGLGLISLSQQPSSQLTQPMDHTVLAAPQSPVVQAVRKLEVAGVNLNGGLSPAEAQNLIAAAAALPEGAAKQNILSMAKMVAASHGGDGGAQMSGPSANLSNVYDGGKANASDVTATPAQSGGWFSRTWLGKKIMGQPQQPAASQSKAKNPEQFAVPAEKLRFAADASKLPESTRDIEVTVDPAKPIVGQDNALKSLYYGLKMPGRHYNVFVSGPEGSGRETAAVGLASALAKEMKTADDVVQVTNFMQKDNPLLLSLPAGQAPKFEKAVGQFIAQYQANIVGALNHKSAVAARKKIKELVETTTEETRNEFDKQVDAIRLPGDKFGIRLIANDNEDGTVHLNWAITHAKDGRMETFGSDSEVDAAIEAGTFTRAEWDQALKDAKGVFKQLVEKYSEVVAANNELKEKANEQIEQINGQAAQGLVQQLAMPVMATVGKNRHDTPAHKEYEKASKKRMEDFRAKMAKEVLLAGKYTIVFQFDGQNIGIGLAKVVDGKIVPLNQEQLVAALQSGELTQEAIQAAAEPWAEKFMKVLQENEEAHAKVHENDEPVSAQEKQAMQYVQLMLSHAASNWQLFTPNDGDSKKPDPKEIYQANVLDTKAPNTGGVVHVVTDYSFEGIFGSADGNKKLMLLPNGAAVKVDGPGGASLKSGSLQTSDIWIADALKLAQSPGVWPELMKYVQTGQIEIIEEGLVGLATLKGARYRVPGRAKVVLVGSPMIRMLLQHYDPTFGLNFPQMATAEFEPSLPINDLSISGYLQFFRKVVESGAGLIAHHTKDAMAALLEFASKLSGSNEKLTAQFGVTYSLMREATQMAKLKGRNEVQREDIDSALAARALSGGVYVRHHQELYNKGVFKIMTDGEEVGTMNGLAVIGDDRGVAMRMTVDVGPRGPGDPILVSLDRNAGPEVTGSSFNKALGVEESIIRSIFGYKKSLPVTFRLSFEQNYGGIDGDSATSTIVYALISAISGVPIKQQYANTGSADQRYWVQPIGGVNAKIAGFFDIASSRGLTGKQGVLIPATNVAELNLRPDIVAAIEAGKFHVYQISRIEDAMEILTGVPWETIKQKALENISRIEAEQRADAKKK